MADEAGQSENPVQAAREADRLKKAAKSAVERARAAPLMTAGAAAVGSAAVVAALLYLNRPKKKDNDA